MITTFINITKNGFISLDGGMPFHIPDTKEYIKNLTYKSIVITDNLGLEVNPSATTIIIYDSNEIKSILKKKVTDRDNVFIFVNEKNLKTAVDFSDSLILSVTNRGSYDYNPKLIKLPVPLTEEKYSRCGYTRYDEFAIVSLRKKTHAN